MEVAQLKNRRKRTRVGDNTPYVHRVVAEKAFGKPLPVDHPVHHHTELRHYL